jgi:hypothetical protein
LKEKGISETRGEFFPRHQQCAGALLPIRRCGKRYRKGQAPASMRATSARQLSGEFETRGGPVFRFSISSAHDPLRKSGGPKCRDAQHRFLTMW